MESSGENDALEESSRLKTNLGIMRPSEGRDESLTSSLAPHARLVITRVALSSEKVPRCSNRRVTWITVFCILREIAGRPGN